MHFNILFATKKRERIKQISQLFSFSRTIRRIQSHLRYRIYMKQYGNLILDYMFALRKKLLKVLPKYISNINCISVFPTKCWNSLIVFAEVKSICTSTIRE